MTWVILGIVLVLVAGLMAYVRLAPSDPARWHVDLSAGTLPNAHVFCIAGLGRGMLGTLGDPGRLLAGWTSIALATPRTSPACRFGGRGADHLGHALGA